MGIGGLWVQRASRDYTGATKWGDGYNPIHEVRDQGRGRQIGAKSTLLPLDGPSGATITPGVTSRDIDFCCEDYVDAAMPGEVYRYQEERPVYTQTTPQFRDATDNAAMGEQASWGPHFDSDPSDIWPLPGPTGGTQAWLDKDHGEAAEQQRAIAVPTMPVSGGWLNKARGAQALPESQESGQEGFVWTINNATVQGPGLKELANDRAVQRGTDTPRSGITSRIANQVMKVYGRSFGMGGGPGTPDMYPFQQTAGLKRPWYARTAALPPDEDHQFNSMERRYSIQRGQPPNPYQGLPETDPSDDLAVSDWGF